MKNLILSLMLSPLLAVVLWPVGAVAALVDPQLQNFARSSNGPIAVLALLDSKFSRPFPSNATPAQVRRYLREETQQAWNRVQSSLGNSIPAGDVRDVELHFINVSATLRVTPAGLRALAQAPGVVKIYADRPVTVAPPVAWGGRGLTGASGLPYDLEIIGMDKVLKEFPQVNGTGVLVGHIDTGVDAKHPALAGKVAVFFDAAHNKKSEPFETGTHGTHTAGTILGGPKDGVPMGMAPGARLVGAAGLTGYPDMLRAMEFMVNPDGQAESNLIPRLVSNSWNCEGAPDVEPFYRAISAWEAAGILTVFSAGNAGPTPRSITKPHEHPLSLSIGAFGPDGKIASFSSRGPGVFNGKDTQKPDISAPGVNVVSAKPGGGYASASGTSMAAPHAAGLATLLYQMAPNLTPAKMRELMIGSSEFVDGQGNILNSPVWNPEHGFGRMNAYKAVTAVKNYRFRQGARWGAMMAPISDVVDGFKAFTTGALPVNEQSNDATPIFTAFPTDTTKWVEGASL